MSVTHDCNKIFETQRLQTLTCKHATADAQRQRDGGGKFEKGNFVNGSVWQRDEDPLAEGGSELHSLLSSCAEA